jgi:coenzyme F420-reducing hydrogenase beta subunit
MINIVDKTKCDGCNACQVICPVDCITLPQDTEGFYFPVVDEDVCIDCDLCDRVCHYIDELNFRPYELDRYSTSLVYGCYSNNHDTRLDSTSGGIFSELAERMFSLNGWVGGAVYNPDHTVSHILTDDRKLLPALRSSKYVESYTDNLFKEVKTRLKTGSKVLVVGAPCQINGLYGYLRKDYENLITCDFICLGVNSNKVFSKYIEWLESKHGSKVKAVKFKDKTYGWHRFSIRVDFVNGKSYVKDRNTDPFFVGYLGTSLFLMPACYTCEFRGFPKKSDITLADFWGIEDLDPTMDQDLGTSLVLVNSEKGKAFYESLGNSITSKAYTMEEALRSNRSMSKSIEDVDLTLRDEFFRDLDIYPFDVVAKKYFPMPTVKTHIVNFLKHIYRFLFRS